MKKISLLLALLVCSLLVQAQGSLHTGTRTWKTLSSLMGQSIEKAKSTLASGGMVVYESNKDEESGLESFVFVAANSEDPEYEDSYVLLCSTGKVVALYAQYSYKSGTEIEKKDLEEVVKQIKLGGYTLSRQETETERSPFGDSENEIYYFTGKLYEVRIRHEKDMANFVVFIGETKYQVMMFGE